MNDLIASLAVIFVSSGLVLAFINARPSKERPFLWMSSLAHLASAFVMIFLTQWIWGRGDLFIYQQHGTALYELLSSDPGAYVPSFLLYLMGKETGMRLPFEQSSTGSMVALSTWLHGPLLGSLYAKCLLVALLGFFSKYLIYLGIARFFAARHHRTLLMVCMLLPSVVFWTSGLLKEPIAMIGMGPLTYGTSLLIHKQRPARAWAFTIVGGGIISVFKAYILFPWIVSMSVCFYWQRQLDKGKRPGILKRPLYMVLLAAVSALGMVLLGELFPRYSISNVFDEIQTLQTIGQRTKGNSNYSIQSVTGPQTSSLSQVMLLPLGLFFSLFRPFIFEARNLALLLNALETTFFSLLWIRILLRTGPKALWRGITGVPGLMGMIIFVALFGSIVGIATTNVGTLSRYRIPMMPFYACALFMCNHLVRAKR